MYQNNYFQFYSTVKPNDFMAIPPDIISGVQSDSIFVGFQPVNKQNKVKISVNLLAMTSMINDDEEIQQIKSAIEDIFNNICISSNSLYFLASRIAGKPSCEKAHQMIEDEIVRFVNLVPNEINEFNNLEEIDVYWKSVLKKINLINTTFSPLCIKDKKLDDFKQIFIECLNKVFENNIDIYKKVLEMAIKAYNDTRLEEDKSTLFMTFQFLKSVKSLYEEIFVPSFIDVVSNYLQPIIDGLFHNKLSEYLSKAIEIKNSEMDLAKPLITQNTLRKLNTQMNKIIFSNKLEKIFDNNGLKLFIKEKDIESVDICANLARDTDTINSFARELSFEFEAEAEDCYKLNNPIRGIIELHNALIAFCKKSFSQNHQKILRNAFEKGFNTSLDTASRLLAEEIHHEFISRSVITQDVIDELIAVFRMLSNKDSFEAYHHLLLSRRILMMKAHIVKADEIFLAELRKQCGPEYTKRFDSLFEDLKQSVIVLDEFKKTRNVPAFFKALILSNDTWPNFVPSFARVPNEIELIINEFNIFIRNYHGKKKIQWNLRFTRVKLQANSIGTLKEVKCNGIYAIFLLSFRYGNSFTIDQISNITSLSKEEIEESINVFRHKKVGKLVLFSNGKISLNYNVEPKDGIINTSFSFPSLPKKDNNDDQKFFILQNRNHQVDAAVMLILKKERSMEKSDLKLKVKEMLNFRLEDDLYEKRLQSLAKNIYLKLDQSGRVHYLA